MVLSGNTEGWAEGSPLARKLQHACGPPSRVPIDGHNNHLDGEVC